MVAGERSRVLSRSVRRIPRLQHNGCQPMSSSCPIVCGLCILCVIDFWLKPCVDAGPSPKRPAPLATPAPMSAIDVSARRSRDDTTELDLEAADSQPQAKKKQRRGFEQYARDARRSSSAGRSRQWSRRGNWYASHERKRRERSMDGPVPNFAERLWRLEGEAVWWRQWYSKMSEVLTAIHDLRYHLSDWGRSLGLW